MPAFVCLHCMRFVRACVVCMSAFCECLRPCVRVQVYRPLVKQKVFFQVTGAVVDLLMGLFPARCATGPPGNIITLPLSFRYSAERCDIGYSIQNVVCILYPTTVTRAGGHFKIAAYFPSVNTIVYLDPYGRHHSFSDNLEDSDDRFLAKISEHIMCLSTAPAEMPKVIWQIRTELPIQRRSDSTTCGLYVLVYAYVLITTGFWPDVVDFTENDFHNCRLFFVDFIRRNMP